MDRFPPNMGKGKQRWRNGDITDVRTVVAALKVSGSYFGMRPGVSGVMAQPERGGHKCLEGKI